MIEVQELTEQYVGAAAAIDRAVFPESPWGIETFRNNMKNEYDHPVIALCDGIPAGYGILRQIDAGEILILGVEESRRRQGVGGKILDALLDEANRGENIFLEVRASNEAAIRLYASRGFTEVARRRNYYKKPAEDAVIMMV